MQTRQTWNSFLGPKTFRDLTFEKQAPVYTITKLTKSNENIESDKIFKS